MTAFPHTKGLHTTTHLHPTSALSEVKLISDKDDEETIEAIGTGEHVWRSTARTRLLTSTSPTVPELLPDLKLTLPYQLKVLRSAEPTLTSLVLINSLWPTVFASRQAGRLQPYTRTVSTRHDGTHRGGSTSGEYRRRCACMCERPCCNVQFALTSPYLPSFVLTWSCPIQLPIASYVPTPPEEPLWPSYLVHDMQVSSAHLIFHTALNVIRTLADTNFTTATITTSATTSVASSTPSLSASTPARNGQLMSRSLFTMHGPCVICSMVLLHSCVKGVLFLVLMDRTGGCGGAACVPKLEGVNCHSVVLVYRQHLGNVPLLWRPVYIALFSNCSELEIYGQ